MSLVIGEPSRRVNTKPARLVTTAPRFSALILSRMARARCVKGETWCTSVFFLPPSGTITPRCQLPCPEKGDNKKPRQFPAEAPNGLTDLVKILRQNRLSLRLHHRFNQLTWSLKIALMSAPECLLVSGLQKYHIT